jgi:hypothetical protein
MVLREEVFVIGDLEGLYGPELVYSVADIVVADDGVVFVVNEVDGKGGVDTGLVLTELDNSSESMDHVNVQSVCWFEAFLGLL